MLLFLLLLLASVYGHHIETRILDTSRSAQLGNYYICYVKIGTPKEQVKLAITFEHGDVVLSSRRFNLADSSNTWLPSGEDRLTIGGDVFKWPIKYSEYVDTCGGLCAGELGIGPTSPIWSIWNRALFTRTLITLSSDLDAPETHLGTLPFEQVATEGYIVNVTEYGQALLRLTGRARTKVPEWMYDNIFYMKGNVTFPDLGLQLNLRQAIRETQRRVIESRIVSNNQVDRIDLGCLLFEDYVVHIDRYEDTVRLYISSSSGSGIEIWHQVFIGIFWFIFLYWKMTNLTLLFNYDKRYSVKKMMELWPWLSDDEQIYLNFKVTYTLILWFEIVSTAVVYMVNGPPSYTPVVDYFMSIIFWLSWVTVLIMAGLTWVNYLIFDNYDPSLLQFSTLLRASADLTLITLIVILLLNGTSMDVGAGIIIVFFQAGFLYTLFRTTLSFIALVLLTFQIEYLAYSVASTVVTAVGTWVTWSYFFNSFLVFASEALSVNVNIISAALVLTTAALVSYFHRLFLVANISIVRSRSGNKTKKQ